MRLNWGFGIGVVYLLFAAGMILFAVKASRQKNDLVTEQYYEEAVNYQQRIDAEANTRRYGSRVIIDYLPKHHAIEITMEGSVKIADGTLTFYKPDQAEYDFQLSFHTNDSGKRQVPVKIMSTGMWKIKSSWTVNGKHFYQEKILFIS